METEWVGYFNRDRFLKSTVVNFLKFRDEGNFFLFEQVLPIPIGAPNNSQKKLSCLR